MKKILPLAFVALSASVLGVVVAQEYKKMKALEDELNDNRLFIAKSRFKRITNNKQLNWKVIKK